MSFKDHFSGHAAEYAASRPLYPAALFDFLAGSCATTGLVWDAGCGNGQAARALAGRFDRVYATDASAEQIRQAGAAGGVEFHCEPAERCGLPDHVVDLVTVAQAAHWFDLPAFYPEARRVLKPGGLLALWCYGSNGVAGAVDPLVEQLCHGVLGAWWPPERAQVENGYAELHFPFPRLPVPRLEVRMRWSVDEYLAYLRSWSATQRYRRETGADPVASIEAPLRAAWGPRRRTVRWPLGLLLARP